MANKPHVLSDENRVKLNSISKAEIYLYLRELDAQELNTKVREYSSDFVFIFNVDDYDDGDVVVMITRKEFFDRHGFLEDAYYEDSKLPSFLHECCESTYYSSLSHDITNAKLLELGFEERFM